MNNTRRVDVLLITVTDIETRAVLQAFQVATGEEPEPHSIDDRVYNDLGTLNGTRVYHAISEMGSNGIGGMQQTVAKAIKAISPECIIGVGIAFGVNPKKQNIGDILISKQLHLYEQQRIGKDVLARGDKPHASVRLINFFTTMAQSVWKDSPVKAGVILSGEKLIDDEKYRTGLLSLEPESIGGEMEGAGLYASCQESNIDWIIIKAISDWADGNKRTGKEGRQIKAASNAAKFIACSLAKATLARAHNPPVSGSEKSGENLAPLPPAEIEIVGSLEVTHQNGVSRVANSALEKVLLNSWKARPVFAPTIDATWVGRADELAQLEQQQSGVMVVTGIGGQGKSTLVVRFCEGWAEQHSGGFMDWHTFRHGGMGFRTQLIALIEHISDGQLTGAHLANATWTEVIRLFFQLAANIDCLVVLDNMDEYVDAVANRFANDVDEFVKECLLNSTRILVVMTCRPSIEYSDKRFMELRLGGLDLSEAVELFERRMVNINARGARDTIKDIWNRTEGHPFWLNLIAVQMHRNPGSTAPVLQELNKGQISIQAVRMFSAIWNSLNRDQQWILRCMSEDSRPEKADDIAGIVSSKIRHYNQFRKAFNGLRTLGLIMQRGSAEPTLYDLHPLVRGYVRTEMSIHADRILYIRCVLTFVTKITGDRREATAETPLDQLERWVMKAELEMECFNYDSATVAIAAVGDQLVARSRHEEYFAVVRHLFKEINWAKTIAADSEPFYAVIEGVVRALAEHGLESEARSYLDRFGSLCRNESRAYGLFCLISCYIEWLFGNYDIAIQWGKRGLDKPQMRHAGDGDISLYLALALRDSNRLADALRILAPGIDLYNPTLYHIQANNTDMEASYCGNIGRCLQLLGNPEAALHFYARSACILELNAQAVSVLNRGYAALWIGEASIEMGHFDMAYVFLRKAATIRTLRAPGSFDDATLMIAKISDKIDKRLLATPDSDVDKICSDWLRQFATTTPH